jgi:anti-sigma B factor antagonist
MIDVEYLNNVPVARPRGDIDAATAPRMRAQLAESIGTGVKTLVLDLSATRYIDSAGIDMLFRLSERLRERRAMLLLVIPSRSSLLRLLRIVGLTSAMPVCDTIEQAVAYGSRSEPVRDGESTADR